MIVPNTLELACLVDSVHRFKCTALILTLAMTALVNAALEPTDALGAGLQYTSANRSQRSGVSVPGYACDPFPGEELSSQDLLEFNPAGLVTSTIPPTALCLNLQGYSAEAVLTHSAIGAAGFSGTLSVDADAADDDLANWSARAQVDTDVDFTVSEDTEILMSAAWEVYEFGNGGVAPAVFLMKNSITEVQLGRAASGGALSGVQAVPYTLIPGDYSFVVQVHATATGYSTTTPSGTSSATMDFSLEVVAPECPPSEKPLIKITKLDQPAGARKLLVKGEVTLDHPFDPPIDPVTSGVRVEVRDAQDDAVVDVVIPGGAFDKVTKTGWKANAKGTTYTWKSAAGVDGIFKVILKWGRGKSPGTMKFKVIGKNGDYSVDALALPLTAVVRTDAVTDQCGSMTFEVPGGSCGFTGKTVVCK